MTVLTSDREARATVVFLVGGPGGNATPNLADEPILNGIANESNGQIRIIVPAYLGTDFRSMYPKSDFLAARSEISALIENEQRNGTKVCVVGASLGGYLAASLAKNHQKSKFLLINPVILKPSEFLSRMRMRPEGRIIGLRYWHVENAEWDGKSRGTPKYIADDAFWITFFGDYFNNDIIDFLDSSSTRIIYASGDPRIGVDKAEEIRKRNPDFYIKAVNSNDHVIESTVKFRPFVEEVNKWVGECLK
ncbi:YqiA/YcfP family alpha/beta fold hydrolase [Sphingomonas sp. 32-62-10]|uniref:YqiA/YcfP family alpha/beta fold hydrolase n=1 Tax=Sphingomonas sp. 32-62-10 TaxID=1970436 RepID=UPI0035A8B5EA